MKKYNLIILFLIIALASILRLWQLGNVPPSPDWDEAALGYNAYSIAHTGRDEYGKFLPIILRSFDDYKPAFYAYLTIPSIEIFGLNVFSVRLPSALFGIFTVIGCYFFVKELFSKSKYAQALGLFSSFLLAISPLSIQFSRIGFESNIGVAFNLFGILFFLKGLKKPILLLLSALFLSSNLYVYQSEKVFSPLLLLILALVFKDKLLAISKKYLIASVILGLFIAIPIVNYSLADKGALARAQGVSIFSDSNQLLEQNSLRLIEDKKNNDFVGLILDNRRVVFAKSIISGYLSHFDLNWLFITGDSSRHHAPNMGILYIWELPFLLFGIYMLIFGDFDKKIKLFIVSWFLIAPIPASVTSGVPHAVRTLNFLPIFQIFTAIGIVSIINVKFKILNIKYLVVVLSISLLLFNFIYYLNQYFVQQNYFYSKDWQFGYKEAIDEVQKIESKYTKIVVTNKPYLDQSYMFFLFYLKYQPLQYQKEAKESSGGFREDHRFGKYEFRSIEWDKEVKEDKFLYVGRDSDFPSNAKVLKTIQFLDGSSAIKIVEG